MFKLKNKTFKKIITFFYNKTEKRSPDRRWFLTVVIEILLLFAIFSTILVTIILNII